METVIENSNAKSNMNGMKTVPVMLALLISGFMGLFSETALNVALTELMDVLNVSASTVQWLTTGYLLTLGIVIPFSGLLLQWFSTKQLFVTSLIFSLIGAFLAAVSTSFNILLIARVIQAVGTGIILPLIFNTILFLFPPNKRGSAMGIVGLVIMAAPAIGPSIAGLVTEKMSWHWIFWISIPFLVMSLIFGIINIVNVNDIKKPKIDVFSLVLSTLGFGSVVFGFSSTGESNQGWGSAKVIFSLILGVICLILFVKRQLTIEKPMMNMHPFKYPMFVIGVLSVFISTMLILSTMFILPIYLQNGFGLSALSAGLLLLPSGVINGAMSLVMGRLFDKYGPKWLVVPGFVIATASIWFFTFMTTTSATVFIIILHSCLMIGMSMVMMPSQTNGLNQLPRELYADGTAILNTLQQVAGAIGTALAASLLSAGSANYMENTINPDPVQALTAGVHNSFLFGITISIVGVFVTLFIKRVRVN